MTAAARIHSIVARSTRLAVDMDIKANVASLSFTVPEVVRTSLAIADNSALASSIAERAGRDLSANGFDSHDRVIVPIADGYRVHFVVPLDSSDEDAVVVPSDASKAGAL